MSGGASAPGPQHRLRPYLVFVLLALLYVFVSPPNRLEAEDAYNYAWSVEREAGAVRMPGDEALMHRHHVLYGVVMRGLYMAARATGLAGRAYPMMCAVSLLAGLAAIGVLAVLLRRSGFSRVSAAGGAALLAASYGWWRYSVEAEIYVPAASLALLAVALSCRASPSRAQMAAGIGLSALATLTHILAGAAAFMAIPFFHVLRGHFRRATVHGLLSAALVAGGYGLASRSSEWNPESGSGDMGRLERAAWAALPVKAGMGQGQAIVSGNFLFALRPVREQITTRFPYRMLDEECFMGRGYPLGPAVGACATAVVFSIVAFAVFLRRVKTGRRDRIGGVHFSSRTDLASALRWMALTWYGVLAGTAAVFEPANPEMWIMALPPLALFLALWFCRGESSVAADVQGKPPHGIPLLLLAGLMGLHNLVGGFGPLWTKAGDYARMKSDAVFSAARMPGDVILTGDGPVFFRWLRYHAPRGVEVSALTYWPGDDLSRGREALARPGWRTVYALPDVFEPPHGLAGRFGGKMRKIRAWSAEILPVFHESAGTPFGPLRRADLSCPPCQD